MPTLSTQQQADLIESIDWPWQPPLANELDERVKLLNQVLPLCGLRVLEPACLDGYHTLGLRRCGAIVSSFDIRPMNVLRTYVRGLLHGERWDVRIGDALTMADDYAVDQFDVLYHSGLLYHFADPVSHLKAVAPLCRWLALDTHTAPSREALRPIGRMSNWDESETVYWGSTYTEHGWTDPFSGIEPTSRWLDRSSLFDLLTDVGFVVRETLFDNPEALNGPRVFLLCERQP